MTNPINNEIKETILEKTDNAQEVIETIIEEEDGTIKKVIFCVATGLTIVIVVKTRHKIANGAKKVAGKVKGIFHKDVEKTEPESKVNSDEE